MFAVIKTGGKQYKVAKDDILKVEKLAADAGETVQFNEVLMVGATIGSPLVAGAAVQAEILDQIRGPKTIKYVKRRRKHSSQRKRGHRQSLTLLKVTDILEKGGDKTGVKAAVGAGSAIAVVAEAAPKKAAPKKAAPKKAEAAAPAEAGAAPANLLNKPKGDKDDLKKISGVGPKLEGLLNENGVYHYWQIADWNADDIAYMDDKLSFKGRIERDNWTQQAKDLAADSK